LNREIKISQVKDKILYAVTNFSLFNPGLRQRKLKLLAYPGLRTRHRIKDAQLCKCR